MFTRILLPYDGSELARQAVPVAARLARASGGSVLLLRVASPLVETVWPVAPSLLITQDIWQAERDRMTAEMLAVAASEDLHEVPMEIRLVEREGSIAEMILATAQSWRADLIVMCSHGRSGLMRWMLGSIAHKIVRHSPVPVLLLRARGQSLPAQGTRPVRVLVGLDGSSLAEMALAPAAHLSAALSAPAPGEVSLVRVLPLSLTYDETRDGVEARRMQQEAEDAQISLLEVEQTLAERVQVTPPIQVASLLVSSLDIAETLIRVAETGEEDDLFNPSGCCDLIALATHGRTGLAHWVMGSVTERVLYASKLPLLIVPALHAMPRRSSESQEQQLAASRAGRR